MSIINLLTNFAAKIDPNVIGLTPVSADKVVLGALNLVYFIAGVTAVVIIILAGYSFSIAVYDPAKITQAKNAILYSIVGLIVIIMAFVITQFIMGRF